VNDDLRPAPCTARSILSEGILRKDGAGRFQAYSAGSQPKGTINHLERPVLYSLTGHPLRLYLPHAFVYSELQARIQSRSAPFKEGFDLLITAVASTKFNY
jgi:hypothetical protein